MSNNGPSATDIITYIGVPLAVLGVLPIMYNTFITLVNASKIKRMLRHSRLTALTRSDVVNRVIEIELPRYAVTPWDRFQHRQEYWTLSRNPSSIPGGSWTTFNWKTNAIGFKTQRVEYADQLRQPQVDIAFDELISYLLDLGAVPDPHGWRLLRSTGLWTPVGCALMKSPDGHHNALAVATLDDSDGNLSLSVTWEPTWTCRSFSDLPPYWVSLPAPPPEYKEEEKPADENKETGPADDAAGAGAGGAASSAASSRPTTANNAKDTKASQRNSVDSATREGYAAATTPITCQVSVDGIITALTEEKRRAGGVARNNTMGGSTSFPLTSTVSLDSLYIEHIRVRPGVSDGVWFASAATAYGTSSQTILWNYRIPDDILAFARRETVPCGVLVLLGAADESETPEWATQHSSDHMHKHNLFVQRMNEARFAEQAEQRLPAHQREAAARDRRARENMQRIDDMRADMQRDRERREQREMEALHSAKWDTRLVAEHALRWLLREKKQRAGETSDPQQPAHADMKEMAGHVLHRMVRDGEFAGRLCRMLDQWKSWADLGGMKKADLQALRADMETFVYAALLVSLIKDSTSALDGTLSVDLQECMRMWRKLARVPVAHTHSLAQRAQCAVVLLGLPDFGERLVVLQLEVVVLGQRAERVPRHDVLGHLFDGLVEEEVVLPAKRWPEYAVDGCVAGEANAVDAVAPLGRLPGRRGRLGLDLTVLARFTALARLGRRRRCRGGCCLVGLLLLGLLDVETLDLVAQHVRVGDAAEEAAALLQRRRHVLEHGACLLLRLERVVHAEHHADNIKAAPRQRVLVEAHVLNNVDVANALAEAVLDHEPRIEHARRNAVMVPAASTAPATAAAPCRHLAVPVTRLVDADVGRVQPHVQLHLLRRLVPLAEIAAFAAANVEHQQLVLAGAADAVERALLKVLVGRKLLNDAALDPVVHGPQAPNCAGRLAPLAPAFGDGVVVRPHNVVNHGTLLPPLQLFLVVAFALEGALADGFALGIGDASPLARPFGLARQVGATTTTTTTTAAATASARARARGAGVKRLWKFVVGSAGVVVVITVAVVSAISAATPVALFLVAPRRIRLQSALWLMVVPAVVPVVVPAIVSVVSTVTLVRRVRAAALIRSITVSLGVPLAMPRVGFGVVGHVDRQDESDALQAQTPVMRFVCSRISM
ncbi:hypothetical protein SPBR_06401 [Sporothrix brasiliensis 5110]|uniref:Uncharacterized protein n=1 Tax=Sporothrix brasiliensis 5110 TaxID=1398154 RepID=A0A0C2IT70_9PEZI|nr:uncharacterized protein SPBR_06401 [Sporothrix brasiliensis 5110]KIH88202.1 hypothetical protein SPBR_06401 [Sporothrix brasiliensis 5110]